VRVTSPVTLFATAVWLASACSPIREFPGSLALERRHADGRRRAAVAEVAGDEDAGVGSLLLLADLATGVDAKQLLAAFDRHVEALEWQGEDLLPALGHLLREGPGGLQHPGLEHPLLHPLILLGVEAQLLGGPQIGGGDVGDIGRIRLIAHRLQGFQEGALLALEILECHLADLLLALADFEVHLDLRVRELAIRGRMVVGRLGHLIHEAGGAPLVQTFRDGGLVLRRLALAAAGEEHRAREGKDDDGSARHEHGILPNPGPAVLYSVRFRITSRKGMPGRFSSSRSRFSRYRR